MRISKMLMAAFAACLFFGSSLQANELHQIIRGEHRELQGVDGLQTILGRESESGKKKLLSEKEDGLIPFHHLIAHQKDLREKLGEREFQKMAVFLKQQETKHELVPYLTDGDFEQLCGMVKKKINGCKNLKELLSACEKTRGKSVDACIKSALEKSSGLYRAVFRQENFAFRTGDVIFKNFVTRDLLDFCQKKENLEKVHSAMLKELTFLWDYFIYPSDFFTELIGALMQSASQQSEWYRENQLSLEENKESE